MIRDLKNISAKKFATAPNGSEGEYTSYIVADSPSDAFLDKKDYIAIKIAGVWRFVYPEEGREVYVEDLNLKFKWEDGAWVEVENLLSNFTTGDITSRNYQTPSGYVNGDGVTKLLSLGFELQFETTDYSIYSLKDSAGNYLERVTIYADTHSTYLEKIDVFNYQVLFADSLDFAQQVHFKNGTLQINYYGHSGLLRTRQFNDTNSELIRVFATDGYTETIIYPNGTVTTSTKNSSHQILNSATSYANGSITAKQYYEGSSAKEYLYLGMQVQGDVDVRLYDDSHTLQGEKVLTKLELRNV